LNNSRILFIHNNINFLGKLAAHPEFIAGNVETGFIQKYREALIPPKSNAPDEALILGTAFLLLAEKQSQSFSTLNQNDPNSPFNWTNGKRFNSLDSRKIELSDSANKYTIQVTFREDNSYDLTFAKKTVNVVGKLTENSTISIFLDDRTISSTVVLHKNTIHVFYEGNIFEFELPVKNYNEHSNTKGSLVSPMPGKIVKVLVKPGQSVTKGMQLIIMEAMKMEHTILSPVNGIIQKVNCSVNDLVEEKVQLVVIDESSK